MLKILTFGGLTITLANQPIQTLITRKVEALLIYLLFNPREHSRETLGNLLWDDLPQNRVMGNLRTAISNLKQQLGNYVDVSRHTVSFDLTQAYWTDVGQLESSLQQAEQHRQRSGSLSPTHARQLADALDLYQGDFLEGFHIKEAHGFEEWKVLQQEHCRQQILRALQWLIAYEIEQQQYSRAIEHANRLLEINPLLEDGHRALMQLYIFTDQRHAALTQYSRCVDILRQELNVEPDAKTTALHQQILAGALSKPTQLRTPHNLFTPPTPFVPRPEALPPILENLGDPQCRLLTLVGLGGSGKTRLAIETGYTLLNRYPDGVYFIDLVGVPQARFIIPAVVNALNIPTQSEETLQQDLLTFLNGKRMLLILDNFEHLIEAADLIHNLLTQAPTLTMLITSREKLTLHGEWSVYIEGFPTDGDLSASVQLFINTARRVKPRFEAAGHELAIAQICQLVDGLPLAIELAAAWTHLMSCEQILEHIQGDLTMLNYPLKNLPQRHQSIAQLFEYSWQMLTADEQGVLMRLSLFRSRFDLDAAKKVGQAAYPILRSLSDKSLIKVAEPGWYVIHNLLKQYMAEKFSQTGAQEAAYAQYAGYFLAWIQKQSLPREIDLYYDDIRASLEWSSEHNTDLFMAFTRTLNKYWASKGYLSEAQYWLKLGLVRKDLSEKDQAVALSQVGQIAWLQGDFDVAHQHMVEALPLLERHQLWLDYGQTLNRLGHLALNRGEHETSRTYYERLLTFSEMRGDEDVCALALGNLGLLYSEMGDFPNAVVHLTQSIETYRRLGKPDRLAVLLSNLGTVALHLERYEDAQEHYEESYALAQDIGNQMVMTICQVNLGEVLHHLSAYQEALDYYREGLKSLVSFGDKLSIIGTLESIAYLLIDLDRAMVGVQILGATHAARLMLGAPLSPRETPRQESYQAQARRGLSESDYKNASAKWQTVSLEDVTQHVLEM